MGNYLSNGHHHHPFRRRGTLDGGDVHGLAGILSDMQTENEHHQQAHQEGISSCSAASSSQQPKKPSFPNNMKISVCRSSRSASRASSGVGNSSKKTTVSSSHDSTTGSAHDEPFSEVERLKVELKDAKKQIYEREQQLLKLHREIHKLRSVLDHSDAMSALKPSLSMTMLLSADNANQNGKVSYQKKQGVSGESYGSMTSLGDPMQNINFVWKDFDCRRIIQEALQVCTQSWNFFYLSFIIIFVCLLACRTIVFWKIISIWSNLIWSSILCTRKNLLKILSSVAEALMAHICTSSLMVRVWVN